MSQCPRIACLRSGFTLIEVVTSLSIMSVLLLGLSGAVMISSRAIPTATDIGLADQAVVDAINQLRSDLREARTIRHRPGAGGVRIRIQINDAGASGTPDVITYRYELASGTLTRKVDELDAVVLVSEIDSFTMSLTDDGANASVVYLRMNVSDTIQRIYEMHALLPGKPEVR